VVKQRVLAVVLCALGCSGRIGNAHVTGEPGSDVPAQDDAAAGAAGDGDGASGSGASGDGAGAEADERMALGAIGMRRLSQAEIRTALVALLGSDPGADIELLPIDPRTPFDNDYTTQRASTALVEGMKAVADRAAARLLADTVQRDGVVGCVPTGPADEDCLREFIAAFGRRAFRRPLDPAEIDRFASVQAAAVEADDFYVAIGMVVRAMLQSPVFLYQVEIGEPVADLPGVRKLDAYEIASRLAFLLWGAPPDDGLLDGARDGQLASADLVRTMAERMLADPRARARVDRFHALWLDYESIQLPAELASRMRAESDALIERVVFERPGSWLELFRASETFVDDMLAGHYGLPLPGSDSPRWIGYGDSGRAGLLSHGSFLAAVPKFGDTSPTQRGKLIRNRLLCQEVPPPPPDVNVDEPPMGATENQCKWDRYAAHRQSGSCKTCHEQMDPIGFGLENYDEAGAFRAHDDEAPACTIEGRGEIVGVGSFTGPAELGALLVESGTLDRCLVTQLYRFTVGRKERREDQAFIEAMTERFRDGGHRYDDLLMAIAASPAFAYRYVE
jgi:hypothetical protein